MPYTEYGDRLDTICEREYGSLTEDGMRTLIYANPLGIGRDLAPDVGTFYRAPTIRIDAYTPPSAQIQALRDALTVHT